jgi:hypothetical protein
LLPKALLSLLFWLVCPAWAGNLSFQLTFHPQKVVLTHTGDQPVYELRLYALRPDGQWRDLPTEGPASAGFLAPGQSRDHVHLRPDFPGLGRADPLLVLFKDASGLRFAQLAWRQQPPLPPALAPFVRIGRHVLIQAPTAEPFPFRRSWAIGLPSEGIAALARAAGDAPSPPPPPAEMVWNPALRSTQSLTVDTGQAQRGVWLVHEGLNGELSVQVIGDGVAVGSEQKPAWLLSLKNHGFEMAAALALLAGLLVGLAAWLRPSAARAVPGRPQPGKAKVKR